VPAICGQIASRHDVQFAGRPESDAQNARLLAAQNVCIHTENASRSGDRYSRPSRMQAHESAVRL
jgi:hypothetical protein